MNSKLDELLRRSPLLWRGRDLKARANGLSTGFKELDRILPAGGWPLGAIVEIMFPQPGVGELQLLLPAIADLGQAEQWVVLIDPPFIPYAPALEAAGVNLEFVLAVRAQRAAASSAHGRDRLWSMEQALRTPGCGMVLCWIDAVADKAVRRLQLAAESACSIGVLFTSCLPGPAPLSFSPAALRLWLQAVMPGGGCSDSRCRPVARRLLVQVLKARGSSVFRHVEITV